mmetsp:Transcript_68243/g.181628  ORF Transcript_68243/g.181628 Transcript_68243/m.181628 type:complete len:213 (-) Transcript_68243:1363-2001(-)
MHCELPPCRRKISARSVETSADCSIVTDGWSMSCSAGLSAPPSAGLTSRSSEHSWSSSGDTSPTADVPAVRMASSRSSSGRAIACITGSTCSSGIWLTTNERAAIRSTRSAAESCSCSVPWYIVSSCCIVSACARCGAHFSHRFFIACDAAAAVRSCRSPLDTNESICGSRSGFCCSQSEWVPTVRIAVDVSSPTCGSCGSSASTSPTRAAL